MWSAEGRPLGAAGPNRQILASSLPEHRVGDAMTVGVPPDGRARLKGPTTIEAAVSAARGGCHMRGGAHVTCRVRTRRDDRKSCRGGGESSVGPVYRDSVGWVRGRSIAPIVGAVSSQKSQPTRRRARRG